MPTLRSIPASVLFAALLAPLPTGAHAQSPSPADPVLIENSTVKIRKSDYELELQRLPPDIRPGFANRSGESTICCAAC